MSQWTKSTTTLLCLRLVWSEPSRVLLLTDIVKTLDFSGQRSMVLFLTKGVWGCGCPDTTTTTEFHCINFDIDGVPMSSRTRTHNTPPTSSGFSSLSLTTPTPFHLFPPSSRFTVITVSTIINNNLAVCETSTSSVFISSTSSVCISQHRHFFICFSTLPPYLSFSPL